MNLKIQHPIESFFWRRKWLNRKFFKISGNWLYCGCKAFNLDYISVMERDMFGHLSYFEIVSRKLFNSQSQLSSTTVFAVRAALTHSFVPKLFFSFEGLLSLYERRTSDHQYITGTGSTFQISRDRPNMQSSKYTLHGFSSKSFKFSGTLLTVI